MSGNLPVLALKEDDVQKMLAAQTHIGASNCDFQMQQYVWKKKTDGVHIINLKKTWEKLLLAARAIAAIENPADLCAISARPYGQRAVLKFAAYTGATPIAGRFTPGTFTNQIQTATFREPRLLVVTDPRTDHQPVTEASYVNIPVIALCNTDSSLKCIDIAIPCNNKSVHSIGLMWWMLSREVLRLRGSISREVPWEVMADLYFYRDPEEAEKEEQAVVEATPKQEETWGAEPTPVAPVDLDWGNEVTAPAAAAPVAPFVVTDEWSASDNREWSVQAAAPAPAPGSEWGAATAGTETWG